MPTQDTLTEFELRERIRILESLLRDLPERLAEERRQTPPTEADVDAARERIEGLSRRIEIEKSNASRHKREMRAGLSIPVHGAGTGWPAAPSRIQREAAWRVDAVRTAESEIGRLEDHKLAAIQEHARLEERLGAYRSDQDPRLDRVRAELTAARAALRIIALRH